MSYENPKIFTSDPLAFQRSFEGTLDSLTQQKQNQDALDLRKEELEFRKQRVNIDAISKAYEAQKEIQDKLAKERKAAMTAGYNRADLGDLKEIDMGLQVGIQDSLNLKLEDPRYSGEDATEQSKQEVLAEIDALKGAITKLDELAAFDPEDWDIRNSPNLLAFKNALTRGDKMKVVGTGLDMKLVGDFGEMSLKEIDNTIIKSKAPFEDAYATFEDDVETQLDKLNTKASAAGVSRGRTESEMYNSFKERFKEEVPDSLKSYLYANVAGDEIKNEFKSLSFRDANVMDKLTPEQAKQYEKAQEEGLIKAMYKKIKAKIDPVYSKPEATGVTKTPTQLEKDAVLENRVNNLNSIELIGGIRPRPNPFTDPDFQNNMAQLGFFVAEPVTDTVTGDVIVTIQDQITNNKVSVNSTGLTDEKLRRILTSLAGAKIKMTTSGLPIINN